MLAWVAVLLLLPVTGPTGGGGAPAEVSAVALLDPSASTADRSIPDREKTPLPHSPDATLAGLVVVLGAMVLVRRSPRRDQRTMPVGGPDRTLQPVRGLGPGATPGLLRV